MSTNPNRSTDEPKIDVPDDFDLDELRNKPSSTDPRKRKRCPKCNSTDVAPLSADHQYKYRCDCCYAFFDEAVTGSFDDHRMTRYQNEYGELEGDADE